MKDLNKELGVYLVTDRRWLNGREFCQCVKHALENGVGFVQLREKNISREIYKEDALRIKAMCSEYKVPFVINDDVEAALEFDVDGVHIGQEDKGVLKARAMLGDDKIIGVSVSTLQEAIQAEEEGADYLGVGAVFSTGSKDDAESVSLEGLAEICKNVNIPVVAIGGVNSKNASKVKSTGAHGIAVISAVFASSDVGEAARKLCKSWKGKTF